MKTSHKHLMIAGGVLVAAYLIYKASKKGGTAAAGDAAYSNASGTMHSGMLPPVFYSPNSGIVGAKNISPDERDGYNFYKNKPKEFITRALGVISSTRNSINAELQRLPAQGGPMQTKQRLGYQLRALDLYERVISKLPNR